MMQKEKTMAYYSNTHVSRSGFIARSQAIFGAVSDYMNRRRIYRTTLIELNSLSNRDLADMGINRSMIKSLAMSAAGFA